MPLKVLDADGNKVNTHPPGVDATYYYGGSALAPVATPTAIIVIKAAASKVVRVRRIKVSGAATAAGTMPVIVTKRTTDGTPGSAQLTAVTAAQQNTDDAAATASVSTVGTANYTTPGTAQGVLGAGRVCMTALGTGLGVAPYVLDFPKPVLLKAGSTEEITVELGGAAVPSGGVIDWEVVTEEASA